MSKSYHLVMDVNGTLAVDGTLMEGIPRTIASLSNRLEVHLITADTHGQQDEIDQITGIEGNTLASR